MTVTGGADALLHVRARDVEHFEEVLERIRGRSRSSGKTISVMVLSHLIQDAPEAGASLPAPEGRGTRPGRGRSRRALTWLRTQRYCANTQLLSLVVRLLRFLPWCHPSVTTRKEAEEPLCARITCAAPAAFLVCEPRHFAVQYAINPWMSTGRPVDVIRALDQWQALVDAYRAHGHTVDTVGAVPGLPDMVFAANCAVVVEGRVFGSHFHAPERRPESVPYEAWFKTEGFEVQRTPRRSARARATWSRPAAGSWPARDSARPVRRIARCRSSSACR